MIDRSRLAKLMQVERDRFRNDHPTSAKLFEAGKSSMAGGVPMSWMSKWPGDFPLFVKDASGARFSDVDGRTYVDLCLGDTGAMTGHSPEPTVRAVREQIAKGITAMLPTEDALVVSTELARRFGLPLWQFTLTATDANRHAIRYARLITGRSKVLVFDRCYHGSVDETFATLAADGSVIAREGNIGAPVPLEVTTRVAQFNDLAAVERELANGDVACLLTEPALTNVGIVLPHDGFLEGLQQLCQKYQTLLIIDETHTISVGPGGMTGKYGLKPDFLTVGKAIGGGVPSGTFGMTHEVSDRIARAVRREEIDTGGIGGTLAGNALSLAAMRATLTEVLTDDAFAKMIPLGERWCDGVDSVIREFNLAWHCNRLGARGEYTFIDHAPINGAEAAASGDFELEQFLHLRLLNDGFLLTPFHNMALMCPATTEEDVDGHTNSLRAACRDLMG